MLTKPAGDASAVIDLSIPPLGPSSGGEGPFPEDEPRDWHGRWTTGSGSGGSPDAPLTLAGLRPKERRRRRAKRRREREREREGEATRRHVAPEEEGEPKAPESPGRKPVGPPHEPQTSTPSSPSNSPLLAHSPPVELDPLSLGPDLGSSPSLREQLKLRPSPPGVTFTVTGDNTTEIGKSFSEQVRQLMQGETVPNSGTLGSDVPDGLIVKQTFDGEVAIEAKYVGGWSRSIYNPDLGLPFDHDAEQNIIDQAKRYAKAYPSGVEWVTNSLGFVKAYAKRFSEAGIQGFHFTVIPAIRR